MLVFKKNEDVQEWVDAEKNFGQPIGFAPTMGALHEGHLDLVRLSAQQGNRTVVSIFVNPTQFNDPNDLKKYPRTPGKDLELLLQTSCDVVYMPDVEAVYPPGEDVSLHLDFGSLDKTMEGAFRPGHFAGMATVVHRLLRIVQPDFLYMGQKDYQQLSIVRDMIRQLQLPVDLVMVPTHREADGLAMSSRNVRLTPDMRTVAPVLYQTLQEIRKRLPASTAPALQLWAMDQLRSAGLEPEYVDIVDGITLLPIENYSDADLVVVCAAAKAGAVRLIDNVVVNSSKDPI
ncbi:MAG: pantoate--beta-alanine ligase [Saprospiraceae bacterium]